MRKVFSSQRVETVEGVARLLRQAGIEVRIRNGRSWQGKRGGQFSYLDQSDGSSYPAVWVVRADDQVHARQLLRQARLLDSTRPSVLSSQATAISVDPFIRQRRSWKLRVMLLALISLGALLTVLLQRAPSPVSLPAENAPALAEEASFRVPINLITEE